MKKYISINYVILCLLFGILTFSALFFKINHNLILNQRETNSLDVKLNGIHGPINITGNYDFTPLNGVSSGSGTYENPYIIRDLIIEVSGTGDCIFINNTNVYFKIQNCTLMNSGVIIGKTTIKFNNVSNGEILNNSISLAEIFLINSHNNSIEYNDFYANSGIDLISSNDNIISQNSLINCTNIFLLYSNNNEISDNYIQNCTYGIIFQYSTNNIASGNEIYDCQDYAIGVWFGSNNTQILENYIYNNGNKTGEDQIDIDSDCFGTILSGNIYEYKESNGDGDGNGGLPPLNLWFLLIILLIIFGSIVIISIVIILIYRRHRKEKELKHPKTSESVDTSDLW